VARLAREPAAARLSALRITFEAKTQLARCVTHRNRGLCPPGSACAKVVGVTQASYVDRARVVGQATISVGVGLALLSVFLPNIGCIGPALSFLGFAAGVCIVLVGAVLRLLVWRAERHPALCYRELDNRRPGAIRDS